MKYCFLILLNRLLKCMLVSIGKNEEFLIKGSENSSGTFVEIIEHENYQNYKKNLCKNLDARSKKIVELILKRVNKYIYKDKKVFQNTIASAIKLRKADKFKKNVTKKEKSGFRYGKYLLSRFHFNNEIFYDKYFINELKNLNRIKSSNIIDVGGFIGDTAVVFSDYTDKNVYVFEPVETNFQDLLKTIHLNNLNNIVPLKVALGAENKDALINIYETTGVGSTIRDDVKSSDIVQESIKITTLDEFIEKEKIDVGLIKVDIEGAERDFLQGAINTIKTQKPALLIAIYHSGIDFFTIKTKLEQLNLGYRFKIRKATKNRILEDTILIAEVY